MKPNDMFDIQIMLTDVRKSLCLIEEQLEKAMCDKKSETEIRIRRSRDNLFPQGYFSDAGWDILLGLDKSARTGQKFSMTDAGTSASIPLTTTLRYLAKLERDGFIERNSDPADRRRMFVQLTQIGQSIMDEIFERPIDQFLYAVPKPDCVSSVMTDKVSLNGQTT
jgi:MarR family transcriptional regulator, temperature-dependent positive regulator of motility